MVPWSTLGEALVVRQNSRVALAVFVGEHEDRNVLRLDIKRLGNEAHIGIVPSFIEDCLSHVSA